MSEPTVEALELPYGTIVGDGATVHADGSDANPHPDVDAFEGVRVTFTPSDGNGRRVNTVIWTGADGPTILHPQVEVGRFEDGRLVLDVPTPPQPDGMRLMATVSDDMVPNSWGWKMEWTGWPSGKGPGPVIFPLAPGATVDIAEALAGYLPEVPAVEFDNLLAAANEVLAARDETLALRDEVGVISGLTGEDEAVATLVAQPTSSTRTTLESVPLTASDASVATLIEATSDTRAAVDARVNTLAPDDVDVAAWVDADGATTAAVQATVRAITGFINARDLGAVGDGVTDDTDALQAGINAAITTGRALYIPSGVYMIRSLSLEAWLHDGDSLSIYGDGAATVIKRLPGSALGNNMRMIYIRGRGHAESVEIRRLKLDGNARENPFPEGNLDPYLWQQNHSLLTSDDDTVGSIREVRYEDLIIDDPMADGLSFAGRALGNVFVTRITVPARNRTRSDVQFSRPVKAAWVTDCDLKSLEMEWVSQPVAPMQLTINNVITGNLDLGAASLGLNCIVSASNVTAAAVATFRGILGSVRDSTLTIAPGNSNEIRSSNGLRFIGCRFLISDPLVIQHSGTAGEAPSAPIFEDCHFVGSTAVIAVNMGYSSTGIVSATFRRCEFSGPLTSSIRSDRSGLVRVEDCKLVGTTEAIHMTATAGSPNRLEWHAGSRSSVVATNPVRVNSAVADLAIVLTGTGWAWGEQGFSGQVPVNASSSRAFTVDAAPTGKGVAGDVARLRTPIAGQPYQWVATATSGTNAAWKVIGTVPA